MMRCFRSIADAGTTPSELLPALTAEWWQWALSIPASVNPLVDTTGEHCLVGQNGALVNVSDSNTYGDSYFYGDTGG